MTVVSLGEARHQTNPALVAVQTRSFRVSSQLFCSRWSPIMSAFIRIHLPSCTRTSSISILSSASRACQIRVIKPTFRSFATHRDPYQTSSLLSQELDRLASRKKSGSDSESTDHVGPFPLGMPPLRSRANEPKYKKWEELSAGGKGAQSSPFLFPAMY